MNKRIVLLSLLLVVAIMPLTLAGNGNPRPGYPHDTIIIHVQKGENGPKQCDGGHSLFLRHEDGVILETFIYITMVDWIQVDNDGDGLLDEDPPDGIDNDFDGSVDEDPLEPGATTTALDCDAWGDYEVSLQIRDSDPRSGYISTQEWFMRMIGKPEEYFAFTSYANQTVSCSVDPGLDGELGTEDDGEAICVSGDSEDWVELASYNLADYGCVKKVKLGGKGVKAGGKTPFCDITEGFLVDVMLFDTNGDGVIDDLDEPFLLDQFVFTISCLDNPETEVDETLYCPLSSVIWDIDEENTTSKAKVQIFVGHTGAAKIKVGKVGKVRGRDR